MLAAEETVVPPGEPGAKRYGGGGKEKKRKKIQLESVFRLLPIQLADNVICHQLQRLLSDHVLQRADQMRLASLY